jgi:hypothetical protein
MSAENNYDYQENQYVPLTGWHKVYITKITEPKPTKRGDATGFFICLDVENEDRIVVRDVFLSFDHPSEFVARKSNNIGAMLREMFPAIHNDEDYIGQPFWLLFRTYKDKQTGEIKESFFDFRDNVSLDGITTLHGEDIKL